MTLCWRQCGIISCYLVCRISWTCGAGGHSTTFLTPYISSHCSITPITSRDIREFLEFGEELLRLNIVIGFSKSSHPGIFHWTFKHSLSSYVYWWRYSASSSLTHSSLLIHVSKTPMRISCPISSEMWVIALFKLCWSGVSYLVNFCLIYPKREKSLGSRPGLQVGCSIRWIFFAWRHSVNRLSWCRRSLSRWMYKPVSDCLRECKTIPSNKFSTTVSQKNAELYVMPFGTSTRLLITLTDQRSGIKHFVVSIFWLTLSRTSSRVDAYIESRG
jgi:hypothetical protein